MAGIGFARTRRIAATAAMLVAATCASASADPWPNSNSTERDPVTGFICLASGCDFVRLPGTQCICKKENPGEERLARLKLTCSTTQGLRWVACPVRPPFGN